MLFLGGEKTPQIALPLIPHFRGTYMVVRGKSDKELPETVKRITRTKQHGHLCDLPRPCVCGTGTGTHVAGLDSGTSAINLAYHYGATRIIPGSHRMRKTPQAVGLDAQAAHPDEVLLIAPVGTVVVFNSHCWHGATQNRSDAYRPNVTSFWARRRGPFDKSLKGMLSPLAAQRFSPAARELFVQE